MLGQRTTGALHPRRWDSWRFTSDPLFPMTTICPFAFGAVMQSIGQMHCTQKLADNDPDRSRNPAGTQPEHSRTVGEQQPDRSRAAAGT
jgi:hypothetical protein